MSYKDDEEVTSGAHLDFFPSDEKSMAEFFLGLPEVVNSLLGFFHSLEPDEAKSCALSNYAYREKTV